MRLRGQYTIVIGGLVASSVVVLGAALLAEQRRYAQEIEEVAVNGLGDSLEREIEKHGAEMAAALAARVAAPLERGDFRDVTREAVEQRDTRGVESANVFDPNGLMIGDTGAIHREEGDDPVQPWIREALARGKPSMHRDGDTVHVVAPIVSGQRVLGAAIVDLAMDGVRGDIQIEKTRLHGLIGVQSTSFSLTGIAVGIVLVTVAIVSAIGVAGGLSRPVVAFASLARRIGQGDRIEAGDARRSDEIGDLARAFDELAETLERTTVSKDYFDSVLRSMADMLVVTDSDGRIVTANPSCLSELGCSEEELRGREISALLTEPDAASASGAASAQGLSELRGPAGERIPVRVAAAPLRSGGGPSGYVYVMQNVAARLAAEQQLERSLAEKEILLREIHHRVKNNLQIISSMLSLQSDRSSDDEMRQVFHESEIRIRAMALVHEQLYRSGDLSRVDLARYLETLARQVIRYFGRDDCHVDVRVAEAVREVSVDQAIPIGLIVNELVANAVKHGFARLRSGCITVELTGSDQSRTLVVSDDGSGFPGELDLAASESLGLKLVQALVEQLGGRLSASGEHGARFSIELPGHRAAVAPALEAAAASVRSTGGLAA
ncbi:MAG TPA: histidine kinase dimerization/phosphoacceptor domain -containing protein [Candidatus Binatia bacterium]